MEQPSEEARSLQEIAIKIDSETGNEYLDNPSEESGVSYDMVFLGSTTVDRRYHASVMPWVVRRIMSENKKLRKRVELVILQNALVITEAQPSKGTKERRILESFSFDAILRLAHLKSMDKYVGFLTVPIKDSASCICHAFEVEDASMKADFLKNFRTKILDYQAASSDSARRQPGLTVQPVRPTHRRNLSSGAILNSNHQDTVFRFSVYYVGKVVIPQPNAPPKLVDEVLKDLKRNIYQEKSRDKASSAPEEEQEPAKDRGKPLTNGDVECGKELVPASPDRRRSSSDGDQRKPEPINSCQSNGNKPSLADIQEDVKSRLVTFQISMSSLMLFNYGSKTLLLEKKIRDISFCTKAEANPDHFGFVCRENTGHTLYTFQGESETVVDNIMKGMQQAFSYAVQASAHLTLCESCPLRLLHALCKKLDGAIQQVQQSAVQECVETLGDADHTFFMNAINKASPANEAEHMEIIVSVLRDIFDQRQKQHKHPHRSMAGDSQGIMGHANVGQDDGRERSKSTFFEKAKRLTNSLENLLTRRARTKTSTPHGDRTSPLTVDTGQPYHSGTHCLSPVLSTRPQIPEVETRPRSRTYNSCPPTPTSLHANQKIPGSEKEMSKSETAATKAVAEEHRKQKLEEKKSEEKQKRALPKHPESPSMKSLRATKRQGSWRQAIYDSVITVPGRGSTSSEDVKVELVFEPGNEASPSERARSRWQKAIKEQILLIRMEKENRKLDASLVATETRRLKLSYDDHTKCSGDCMLMWDELLCSETKDRIDDNILLKAVRTGVPKVRRGEIWQLLIRQHSIRTPDSNDQAWKDPKYEELMDEPTSHQHAILIDLGRTFPSHRYFTSQLGPGQLSLFNVLKAYSLLDAEVGYCQGLSFVVGLLLMHMPEKETFECFRHIMFKLGIRNQYKPDMNAVQQQLYQLSRLLHDYHISVYEHLKKHDVTPTLYAAPWFLTLFASQYPVGFVSRVMDLLFFQGLEVIFKVALVIIGLHAEEILACDSFETVVDYLKLTLPERVKTKADEIISRALDMDIKQQLNLFEVEYQLLNEEMIDIRQNRERFERQESTNRELQDQVDSLKDELQKANETIKQLRHALSDSAERNKVLEARFALCRREKAARSGTGENPPVTSPISEVERILSTEKTDGCTMEKSWELVPSPTTVSSQMDSCLDRVRSFDDNEPISRSNSDECCDEVSAAFGEACREKQAQGEIAASSSEILSDNAQSSEKRRNSFPVV